MSYDHPPDGGGLSRNAGFSGSRVDPGRNNQSPLLNWGLRDYGTSPLVWGGEPEHEHSFNNIVRYAGGGQPSDKQRWQHTGTGPSGHPKITTGVCPCGAWLGSLGLEPTPELYVEHIVECFRHVHRVLRDDSTLWINLGDSYAGSGRGTPGGNAQVARQIERQGFNGDIDPHGPRRNKQDAPTGWKAKDLLMIPFRVAMALQADGWWLRSVIPWLKRNSMPESVTDRPSTSVEYVFLLSKSSQYYWDADAVRVEQRGNSGWLKTGPGAVYNDAHNHNGQGASTLAQLNGAGGRNRRNSDWFFESWQGLMLDEQDEPLAFVVNPAPFKGSHFAVMPAKLVEPMVKASTSERGQCPECGAPWARIVERKPGYQPKERPKSQAHAETGMSTNGTNGSTLGLSGWYGGWTVQGTKHKTTGWQPTCAHTAEPIPQTILDPFSGTGTVLVVADRLSRNAIGCELKPEYSAMAVDRLTGDAPMFVEVTEAQA